jgi:hypothetical protein
VHAGTRAVSASSRCACVQPGLRMKNVRGAQRDVGGGGAVMWLPSVLWHGRAPANVGPPAGTDDGVWGAAVLMAGCQHASSARQVLCAARLRITS